MIQETIVTTQNNEGVSHIAPMGIHVDGDKLVILPFRPSTTLNNFLETKVGVINYCDDVRVFAGCLTGRRGWALKSAVKIQGKVLECALAHTEVALIDIEENATRPKLVCKSEYTENHQPFKGFNRAQFAVLEAAILISRIDMLPLSKIESEIEYLSIGFGKTAGAREQEAWAWIMTVLDDFRGKKSE